MEFIVNSLFHFFTYMIGHILRGLFQQLLQIFELLKADE